MADSTIRQIKIKTGVVKRLTKEKAAYEKEVGVEKGRLAKMKDMGKEERALKRQEEVIQETAMMVPDCQKRLFTAYNGLKQALESAADLAENEVYLNAQAALKEAEPSLQ